MIRTVKMGIFGCLLLLLWCPASGQQTPLELCVAPWGKDSNTGSLEQPFHTLERARDHIRGLKKRGMVQDVNIYLRDGTYHLKRTFELGIEDSAPEGKRITISNYRNESPVLSSGIKIEDWVKVDDAIPGLPDNAVGQIWSAPVPGNVISFYTLYEGDTRLPRARTTGFYPVQENDGNKPENSDDLYYLHFPEGKIKDWPNPEDVEIFILPSVLWTMNILPLESVDSRNHVAKTRIPATYPMKKVKTLDHFPEGTAWVENVFEGLDQPGEWVLNTKERRVYLWPLNQTPGDDIMVPGLKVLIKVAGETKKDEPSDNPVKGIHFKGLTFTIADRNTWDLHDSGIQHDFEMEDKDNAMLRFRGAEDCSVDACHFHNAGGNAIRMDYHAQRIEVRNCLFHDLGASAVMMLGYGPGTKDVNKYNKVVNNHISFCGQIWWHSQMITAWQSGGNLIAHNYIHHVPRKAICIAGVRPPFFQPDRGDERENRRSIRFSETGGATRQDELYPFLHARNNVVEYNHIHHALEKMGDGAAINLSGTDLGNIVRYNYIHDIHNPLADACIRCDNAQNGTSIHHNIVFRSYAPGICPKGKNQVVNNFLINVSRGNNKGMVRALGNFGNSDICRNIFYTSDDRDHFFTYIKDFKPPEIYRMMTDNAIDHNVYFSATDTETTLKPSLADLRKYGFDQHSSYSDPMFENLNNENFRLNMNSPALKAGIGQVEIVDKAGLTTEYPSRFLSLAQMGIHRKYLNR